MNHVKQNASVIEAAKKIKDDSLDSDQLKDQVFQLCIGSWGRNGPATGKERVEEKKNGVELMNYLINTTLYGTSDRPRLPVFCKICPDDESQ